MAAAGGGAVTAVVVVPLLLFGLVAAPLMLGGGEEAGTCESSTVQPAGNTTLAQPGKSITIDPATVPDIVIAGYGHEQLVNAAYVMQAGKDMNLSVRDITIGVMTAMGESSLRVIDYGDAVGPDSRGLFQQRDNGAWGTYSDRMDPYISSTNYFRVLATIEGRDGLAPTIVAHRVQRNADPDHYTKYWDAAIDVVERLSGVKTGLIRGTGGAGQNCNSGITVPTEVNANGWAKPDNGPVTSPYGYRVHPITGVLKLHSGTDISAGCKAPIWAANDGVVIGQGFDNVGNGYISIDHGGGVVTRYLHMYSSGMFVKVGDRVTAGQQIAEEGSTGYSTGCHLHFEVMINGEFVDSRAFLAKVGVTLG